MDAMELAQSMMRMPVKDLPVMAKVYLEDLSSRIGVCGECCLMALATYAQLTEGLHCSDKFYRPRLDEKKRYKELVKSVAAAVSEPTLSNLTS